MSNDDSKKEDSKPPKDDDKGGVKEETNGNGNGNETKKDAVADEPNKGASSSSTNGTLSDSSTKKSWFGVSPFALWRTSFYVLMAWHWQHNWLGPTGGPWESAMTYDHTEILYEMGSPKTPEQAEYLRWFGFATCLLAIFRDEATVVFAILKGTHVFSAIFMFINHDYLFFLLASLMAFYCNCRKDNTETRAGWIHALRGQIVVVYFYASLWKLDSDWTNGNICHQIFTSFEEQGVNRGVPWKALYAEFPDLFKFVALSGLALDFSLFCVLAFLPPGHKLQSVAFLFHGFTGYTMSQRIGYAFPIGMVLSGILFLPMEDIAAVQPGGDTKPHLYWLLSKIRRPSWRQLGPLLFLLLQWAIPMRMPFVSNFESRYTLEGYRFSWTMMLHAKSNMGGPGLFFMTLRPKCGGMPFPNTMATTNHFLDLNGAPYELELAKSPRSFSLIQMFPRQMPKMAHFVGDAVLGKACPSKQLTMTTSYFGSANDGPYHRVIDPTVDLLDVYQTKAKMPYSSKLWHAIIDKAPPEKEFILRGAGSISIPYTLDRYKKDEVVLVDRSHCLQVDPIKINSNEFDIEFQSDSPVNFRLLLRGCPETDPMKAARAQCHEIYLERGEKQHLTAVRTISIGIDRRANLEAPGNCSNTTREDVMIKLTNLQPQGIQQQQGSKLQQMQEQVQMNQQQMQQIRQQNQARKQRQQQQQMRQQTQ